MNQVSSLQKLLIKKRTKFSQIYTEIQFIENQLQGICDHSESKDYKWEHDNGYGSQSYITGKRCVFCGWIDLWNRNNYINPDHFTN